MNLGAAQAAGQLGFAGGQMGFDAANVAAGYGVQGAQAGYAGAVGGEEALSHYLDTAYKSQDLEAQRKALLYGTQISGETTASTANLNADLKKDQSFLDMIGTGVTAAADVFSDRRAKTNIRIADIAGGLA